MYQFASVFIMAESSHLYKYIILLTKNVKSIPFLSPLDFQ
ncbi:hypothetical protein HMPREF0023_1010 [Acinetobacter sp. ATCC 27244]|nr:hypothetical protein HMPREF0023_1010 [Acinetobacter sp. ATCC 27244]